MRFKPPLRLGRDLLQRNRDAHARRTATATTTTTTNSVESECRVECGLGRLRSVRTTTRPQRALERHHRSSSSSMAVGGRSGGPTMKTTAATWLLIGTTLWLGICVDGTHADGNIGCLFFDELCGGQEWCYDGKRVRDCVLCAYAKLLSHRINVMLGQ